MKCEVYDLNHFSNYKFVVIIAEYQGSWLLCKHKKRTTWETAGGHIEPGETPLEAAKRELYEETGAILYRIEFCFNNIRGERNGFLCGNERAGGFAGKRDGKSQMFFGIAVESHLSGYHPQISPAPGK